MYFSFPLTWMRWTKNKDKHLKNLIITVGFK